MVSRSTKRLSASPDADALSPEAHGMGLLFLPAALSWELRRQKLNRCVARALVAVGLCLVATTGVIAADPDIKVAQPGQNITVWDGWNVNATIFLKLDGGPGDDCIKLWWIKMGVNSKTWQVCNQAEIKVNLPLIYGKLRAGNFVRQTAIAVSDNATVSDSAELCNRIIDC